MLSRALLSALLVSLLAGCASTTEIRARNTEPPSLKPGTVLLAARSPDPAVRRQWEQACAPGLKRAGVTVMMAHQQLPGWYENDNDALQHWADGAGVSQLLVADVTPLFTGPAQHPSDQPWGNHQGHLDDAAVMPSAREYRALRNTPDTTVRTEVQLVMDGKLAWVGDLYTDEANQIAAVARSQCRALGALLR